MKRRASSRKKPSLSSPDWLLWLAAALYFLLPFVVSISGLDKFRGPKDIVLLGFCSFAVAVFLMLRQLRFRRLSNSWNLALLGVLLYTALHVLILGRSGVSFPALQKLVGLLLLMLVLVEILDEEKQYLIWLVAAISVSLNALLTVAQYFGAFPLMERAGGGILSGRLNPAGAIGEVNSGGFLFALIALIALGGMLSESEHWRRGLWGAILVANLVGLIFTRTLTAVAGFGFCLGLWVIWEHWRILVRGRRSRRWLLGLWCLMIAGGAGILVISSRARLSERVTAVVNQIARGNLEAATAGRQQLFLQTWYMIRERPMLGRGLNTFGQDFFTFRVNSESGRSGPLLIQAGAFRQAHNEYLQLWEELGVFGLLGWLGLLAVLSWQAFRVSARAPDDSTAGRRFHLFLGLILLAFTSLTFFPFHVGVTAAFAILLIASIRAGIVKKEPEPPVWLGWQEKVPPAAFTALGVLLVAFTLWFSFEKWSANVDTGHASELLEVARQQPAGRARTVMVRQALARLEQARKRHPTLFEIENLAGAGYFLLGRFDESIAHYRLAAEYLPSPEVYTNLAAALMSAREDREARELLRKALRYNPKYEPARLALDTLREGS